MVEANARTLRPLVKPALKTAALEHGWRSAKGGAFTADSSVATPPVVVHLDPLLEGDAYGGLRFELNLWVTDPEAEAEAAEFGEAALPADPYLAQGGWDLLSTNAGALIPLMALRIGRADVARAVIGRYERGMDDSPERIAAFERRLAAAHPEYGPLQRS